MTHDKDKEAGAGHASGDRNSDAYVHSSTPDAPATGGTRYPPNYSESQGGSVDAAPEKTNDGKPPKNDTRPVKPGARR